MVAHAPDIGLYLGVRIAAGVSLVLFLHSVGMAVSVGVATVVGLRLIGLADMVRVSSLRVLFRIFWGAFLLNLVTGSLLFAAAATTIGYSAMCYAKLTLIVIGLLLSVPLRRFVDGGPATRWFRGVSRRSRRCRSSCGSA